MPCCYTPAKNLNRIIEDLRSEGKISERFQMEFYEIATNCNVAPIYRIYAFPHSGDDLYHEFTKEYGYERAYMPMKRAFMEVIRLAPTIDVVGEFDICVASSLLVCCPITAPIYCWVHACKPNQEEQMRAFVIKTDGWIKKTKRKLGIEPRMELPRSSGLFSSSGGTQDIVTRQPGLDDTVKTPLIKK